MTHHQMPPSPTPVPPDSGNDDSTLSEAIPRDRAFSLRLFRMTLSLLLAYLAVGTPLAILALHVRQHLGLSDTLGGLSIGIAFLSTIVTRGYAGRFSDHHGGRPCLRRGVFLYALAGAICLLSGLMTSSAVLSYTVLVIGRLILGVGESMTTVGIISWCMSMGGQQRHGRVLSWIGMGMYGAFALGAPLGEALYQIAGFTGTLLVATIAPILGWLLVRSVPADTPVNKGNPTSIFHVLKLIWKPGSTVGLQGIGFAAIGAFGTLDFVEHHWPYAGMALSAFGIGFVVARILFGRLPDRLGGFSVSACSLLIEAVAQYLLWWAPSPSVAVMGAFLTGLGCSMVFPSMGIEAARFVSPQLRGVAMGAFAAFQDLAYGITGPVLGYFTGAHGYSIAFLIGGIAATLGLLTTAASVLQARATHSSR